MDRPGTGALASGAPKDLAQSGDAPEEPIWSGETPEEPVRGGDTPEEPVRDGETSEELASRVAYTMFGRDLAAQAMGMEIRETGVARSTLTMRIREDMLNGHEITHGGVVFALADTAFAYACNSRNEPTVALQCSISFARATRLGELLTARAEERTRTRRTSTYDVTITGEDGEIVALFRGTGYRRDGTYL